MLRRLIFFGFGVFISIMFLSMGPENRLKNTFYAYIDYFNINKKSNFLKLITEVDNSIPLPYSNKDIEDKFPSYFFKIMKNEN